MADASKDTDALVIAAKGLVGVVPVVGPLAAEIIGGIIPNQRIDRLEDTVKRLEALLNDQEKELFKAKVSDPEFVDLFEEAMLQATRALTEKRRDLLATMVKNGMTMACHNHQKNMRLLEAFSRVNDEEVFILRSYTLSHKEFSFFWKPYAREGNNSLYLEIDQHSESGEEAGTIAAYMQNLKTLGLLRENVSTTRMNNGVTTLELTPWSITQFGRMLLSFSGVIADGDISSSQ